jgi:tRNA 2-thiouridine synthesizing protein A
MKCPAPLSWATTILRGLKPGDVLEILATDPSAIENFQSFSEATGNELIGWSEEDGVYRLLLRKSA